MSWTIGITTRRTARKIDRRAVRKLVLHLLRELSDCPLPSHIDELGLLFTDNDEIRELNRQYRGKDKPTDVLSFSQIEGRDIAGSRSLGDIAISVEYAGKEAAKRGITLELELVRLIVHGLLHLHGFDHESVTGAERARMKRKEAAMLKTVPDTERILQR